MRLLLFLIFISQVANAQSFSAQEDSLKLLGKQILYSKSESERIKANIEFKQILFRTLMKPGSFDYPFDSLITIARVKSPDKKFRILNWNMRYDDGSYLYSAFIQTPEKVIELNDKSAEIKSPETSVLNKDKWYGAHYYEIIAAGKKKNRYYILLGWKGYDRLITKKVIEVLHFNKKMEPTFGAKVFDYPQNEDDRSTFFKQNKTRIIFEYSADVSMSLKYHADDEAIVFDHLSPRSSNLKGQFQYYGPDLSYDRFKKKRTRWKYEEDIDVRNLKNKTDEIYKRP